MAFQVNGLDVINDSRQVSNIVATTSEAQAGSVNNKVMTPQRTKELIQGGTVSVIKSVQRFSLDMGEYTWPTNNQTYFTWGASSNSTGFSYNAPSGSMSVSTPGATATYCFVSLAVSVNIGKSFINTTFSGAPGHDGVMARFWSNSGWTGSMIQLKTSDWINKNTFFLQQYNEPAITCEIIEYY